MNLLWICTDQQRWDTLGAYGNPYVSTPHLDRLAAEGVLFENAFCNSPVCMPSRASFMTGLYPVSAGVGYNGVDLPECHHERIVTRRMADNGYHGGLSGKLHLTLNPHDPEYTEQLFNHGYAEFNWSPGGNPPRWAGCQYRHWLRDQGVAFEAHKHPDSRHVEVGMTAEYHQTTWCARRASTFIEAMSHTDTPWFYSCNLFDPHEPFDPPADYLAKYLDRLEEIPLPRYAPGELDNKPLCQRQAHGAGGGPIREPICFDELTDHEHRLIRASYWAMVDLIDENVGRILETLEASGQRDNTLVIFTSDHGESLGDHGIYKKSTWLYDESMHVPLILSWPGARLQTRRVKAFAELVDLAPTILSAVGLPYDDLEMHGQSWWPFLNGAPVPERDCVYAEIDDPLTGHCSGMVRTQAHKLVYQYDTGEGELYELREPSPETHNRWNDPAFSDIQQTLLNQLVARRHSLGRPDIALSSL